MAKKKPAVSLNEASKIMLELIECQKQINSLHDQLAASLSEYEMDRSATLNDQYKVRGFCNRITTNLEDANKLYAEAIIANKRLALNIIVLSYNDNRMECGETSNALDSLMDDAEAMYKVVEYNQTMKPERVDKLWELYGERWFKEQSIAPVKLEALCRLFRKHISYEHLELMCKRFVGRKMDGHAKRLQSDTEMNLPEELKDMLEGCIMMKTLMPKK